MKTDAYKQLDQWGAITAACLIILIGLLAVIGWHTQHAALVQIDPRFPPIQYNAALIFILCGIAILYNVLPPAPFNLGRWLGLMIAAYGGATLIEYGTGINLGFAELLMRAYFTVETPVPGRISPLAAITFIFIGMSFFLLSRASPKPIQSIFILLLGILVFCIGFFGILKFFAPIQNKLGWYQETSISVLASICLMISGLGIILMGAYHNHQYQINIRYLYPFFLGLSVIVTSSLVLLGLQAEQEQISLQQSPFLIENSLNRTMIFFVWLGGVILSLALSYLFYLWQTSQRQLQEITQMTEVLNEHKEKLDLAIQAGDIGTWLWDLKERRMVLDASMYRLLGLPIGIPVHTPIEGLQFAYPEDKERVWNEMKNAMIANELLNSTFRIIHPESGTRFLTIRGKSYQDLAGKPIKMTGICWDGTEVRMSQELLEVQLAIAKGLQESSDLSELAPKVIQTIAYCFNWQVGALWLVDEKDRMMHCVSFWHDPKFDVQSFESITFQSAFSKGESFPGLIWKQEKPIWLENIDFLDHFIRASIAEEVGLKGAFGFPVLNDHRIIGVFEFFQKAPFKAKIVYYLDKLSYTVGHAVGLFIQQSEANQAKALLASIVEFSHDAVISGDLNGTITSWNRGAEHLYGYSADEAIGQLILLISPTEKIQELETILDAIKAGKPVENLETMRKRQNGEILWALVSFSPLKDKNGHITGFCAIARNISALKQTEETLRKSEEKFRVFIETTSEWIWSIDRNRKITFSNAGVKIILGYEPDAIIGMDISSLVIDEDRYKWENETESYRTKKKGWMNRSAQWKHQNGSSRWLESNAEPIMDLNGEVDGFRGADRDTTERKNIDKMKNEFISIVSHELRTPLTSIRGSLGLILGKASHEISEKSKHLLDIASNNCERLIRLINDILDIEKIESDKIELHFQPIAIDELIQQSVEINQPFAEKFEVNVVIEKLSDGAKVYGDSRRLLQVLTNLLSNAIKFSHKKESVNIAVEQSATTIQVSIKDRGIGIPEEFKTRIFSKFAQADSSSTRAVAGTGLGLNICKNIIEKHGGTIGFHSKENQGTTFYFNLPRWHDMVPVLNDQFDPLIILSSNHEKIRFMQNELHKEGFSVETAETIEEVKHLLEIRRFGAMIVDLDIVNKEELSSIKQVCEKKINDSLPIIFVSEDLHRLNQIEPVTPIFGWLSKDSHADDIVNFIKEIKKRLVFNKPRILYVEDDIELFHVIQNVLKEEGVVISATTMKQAREKLSTEEFDLVILDLLLSDGMGSDLLPCLNYKTQQVIPVVIFSVKEDQTFGKEVQKILVKSRTTEKELIDIIKSIVKLKKVVKNE
jgi:PAS domain S-box-containing protein